MKLLRFLRLFYELYLLTEKLLFTMLCNYDMIIIQKMNGGTK